MTVFTFLLVHQGHSVSLLFRTHSHSLLFSLILILSLALFLPLFLSLSPYLSVFCSLSPSRLSLSVALSLSLPRFLSPLRLFLCQSLFLPSFSLPSLSFSSLPHFSLPSSLYFSLSFSQWNYQKCKEDTTCLVPRACWSGGLRPRGRRAINDFCPPRRMEPIMTKANHVGRATRTGAEFQ